MKTSKIRELKHLSSQREALQSAIIRYSNMGIVVDKLRTREEACKAEMDRLQTIFESIEDKEVRKMISLYAGGQTWTEVYFSVYGYHDPAGGDFCWHRVARYIANM